jgi:glycosyltransferase involved in cell wall biosynthesis
VAKLLQRSAALLAYGHPEGFGLPLAEAAACGCALIGYSGLGGRELFELAGSAGVGWEVAYGDWQGFLSGAQALLQRFQQQPQVLAHNLQRLSKQVRQRYSPAAMVQSVAQALPRWESQLPT